MDGCSRRDFLRVAGSAAAGLTLAPRTSRAADARIDVLTGEPIGPVIADLYGHTGSSPHLLRG